MEKALAAHSSTLAWKIPWTEEPGSLHSMGSPSGGTHPLSDLLPFCTRKSVALPFTMLACFHSLAALDRLVLESAVLSEKKSQSLMPGEFCPKHRTVRDCLFDRFVIPGLHQESSWHT